MSNFTSNKSYESRVFYCFLIISAVLHLFLIFRLKYRDTPLSKAPKKYDVKIRVMKEEPNPLDKLISRGRDAVEKGNYRKALDDYNKALKTDKDSYDARLGRGILFSRMGDQEKALDDFRFLKESSPDLPGGYYGTAITLAKKDNYDEALKEINRAIELDSYNSQYFSDRGYILLFTKDFDKAKSDFNRALKLNQKNAFAYAGLGEIFRRTNDLEKGAFNYERAIELNDHIPQTHQFLASIYFDQDRLEEALKYYALELEKVKLYGRVDDFHDGACYAEMARIYAMLDNLPEAERNVKKFFKSVKKLDLYDGEDSEHLSLLQDIGNAYIEMGTHSPRYYKDALYYYKRCVDLSPRYDRRRNQYHNFQVGFCYWEMGKPDKAMSYFKKSLEYEPEFFSRHAYWMQGHVLTLLGRYDEAMKKYKKSLEVDPTFENAFFSRGLTYYLMGKNDEALKDIDTVIKLRKEGNALKSIYEKALKVKDRVNRGVKGTPKNIRDI